MMTTGALQAEYSKSQQSDSQSLVSGFESTLNNMGFASSIIDPYCQKFVDFAAGAPGPVLEVGAAFGLTSMAAVKTGARVIANDIDSRHLQIISERVPDKYRSNLKTLYGAAPDLHLSENMLGAILISRVIHFFDAFRIQRMLQNAYNWLSPGGKLFIVAETPFQKTMEAFIPVYEKRMAEGRQWPGLIHDINAFANNGNGRIPNMVHFLDSAVLSRESALSGFIVEEAELFSRPDFPQEYRLDGRESVGLIALKP